MNNNELENTLIIDNIPKGDKKIKYKKICCFIYCIFTIIFMNYISFCIGIIYETNKCDNGSLSEFIN